MIVNTTNSMAVGLQPATPVKAQSSKAVSRTARKPGASDESFDTTLGKATADTGKAAEDTAADAKNGADDAGKQDDTPKNPLAAVLTALQQGNESTAVTEGTDETLLQTQLEDGPVTVLSISEAGKEQFVDKGQMQPAVRTDLQSLIPQASEERAKSQDFLAMLSGQQLKGQAAAGQPQTMPNAQAAQLAGSSTAQAGMQQQGQAVGTILEMQLANSQTTGTGQMPSAPLPTAAEAVHTAVSQEAVSAGQASSPTVIQAMPAAAVMAGNAEGTKPSPTVLDGVTIQVGEGTPALPLQTSAQQLMDQSGSNPQTGQQGSQGQAQSQPVPAAAEEGVQLTQQLPEEAAADRAPASKTVEHSNSSSISMFQQGVQDSLKGVAASSLTNSQSLPNDYDIPRQIVDQARLIRTNENTEMVIKLNPEHLGELTLKVSVSQSGSVNASFHSDNAQVRTIIENSLVQLRQELNNQGMKVDSVEVYAGLADGQLPQDQGQQAWQNQQGTAPRVRGVQLGADDYVEEAESLSAAAPIRENIAMEGVDYRI